MTTEQTIARARALLAGIKAELEKGRDGRWKANVAPMSCHVTRDGTVISQCHGEANARLIAASHNAMPTALEDIERDIDILDRAFGSMFDIRVRNEMIARKLALLETLARDFSVEVEE